MQLTEQYRPRTWEAVIGQEKVVAKLQALARRGLGGKRYLLSGGTGMGKTSIAGLIGAEVGARFEWDTMQEFDAAKLTAAKMDEIQQDLQRRPLAGGRAWIVNEIHGLRADQLRRLLTLVEPLEGLPEWCAFIFTTTADGIATLDGIDAAPFMGRCLKFELNRRPGAEVLAEYVRGIAVAAGLDGQPIEKYVRLAKDCRNSIRDMLNRVEAGAMLEG